jgi:two-component system, chemotaxis family, response regulator Rcp1
MTDRTTRMIQALPRPVEILLVEDSPGDVKLTIEALRDADVPNNLHIARDGEEAMRFLRREKGFEDKPRPDLILLDLNMPRMDGREVLAAIKADDDLRRIPVIILTTSQSEDDIAEAYNLAANCYVAKPVDLDEFLDVVRAIDDFWLTLVRLPAE